MKTITRILFSTTFLFVTINVSGQTWSTNNSNLYANPTSTKVGIGTSSPNSKLHINASSGQNGFRVQIAGSTKFTVASNGGVTIGTYNDTPPANGLKINGNFDIPFNQWMGFGGNNVSYNRLMLHHTGTHGYIDYKDNLHFRADKNWLSALTLYGDGTVGVGFGTTYSAGQYLTQGYKLAVNGGILCESVVVVQDVPNSDFVFENDYNLRSLNEIEEFIKENKHLPEVPSAQEFKEKGYKLGEMDDILLRKIEELTIYLIEQNKRIEALEAENEQFKSQYNDK